MKMEIEINKIYEKNGFLRQVLSITGNAVEIKTVGIPACKPRTMEADTMKEDGCLSTQQVRFGEVINPAKSNVSNICSEFPDLKKQNKTLLDSGISHPGLAEHFNMPSTAVGLSVQPVKDFLSDSLDFLAKCPRGPILGENGSLEEVNPDASESAQEKTLKIPVGQILFANHTDLDPLSIYNSHLSEEERSC